MMGTSTPCTADSEPGNCVSRVSGKGRKSSRSRELNAWASKQAGSRPLRWQGICRRVVPV